MTKFLIEDSRPVGEQRRRYNNQISSEVAVTMPKDTLGSNRDIIIRYKEGGLERINKYNQSYDPLQYPIFFPHRDNGYHINDRNGNKLSIMNYYAYRLVVRDDINYLLSGGRLTQQYIVDQYCKMETSRLNFIYHNQTKLRSTSYDNFRDQILADENGDPINIGIRVIMPATFNRGPRFMHEKQADAMAKVRRFERQSLFITITTNPE